jgi:hypothetical protein
MRHDLQLILANALVLSLKEIVERERPAATGWQVIGVDR